MTYCVTYRAVLQQPPYNYLRVNNFGYSFYSVQAGEKFIFLRSLNKCIQSSVKGLERAMKKGRVRLGRNARHASLVMASEHIPHALPRDSYSTINHLPGKAILQHGGVVTCMAFL